MDDFAVFRAKTPKLRRIIAESAGEWGVDLSPADVERILADYREFTARRHKLWRAMGGVLGADGKWRFYQRHDL